MMVGFAPLAGIGLLFIMEHAYTFFNKKTGNAWLSAVFSAVIFLLVFSHVLYGYYEVDTFSGKNIAYLMYPIHEQDYDAIRYIASEHGTGHIILAGSATSYAVYPVGNSYPVAIVPGNLGYGDVEVVCKFFVSECNEKEDMAYRYNVDFVMTRNVQSCGFLREVYNDSNGLYIYRVI